jgi:hypothetical protein
VAAPAPFALVVGDREAVGLTYWNTVAPAGAYFFANFSDQVVMSGVRGAGGPTRSADSPPSTMVARRSADDSTRTSSTVSPTGLDTAMEVADVVAVVNGTEVAGLGGSLASVLEASDYTVGPLLNATEPVAESVVYFRGSAAAPTVALLTQAMAAPSEQLDSQQLPVGASDEVDQADVIIVLGADRADAPWSTASTPLVSDRHGVLIVLDGSGTPEGRQRTEAQIANLESLGVDVIDGGASAHAVEASMLMPLGETTRWTFAVSGLAGIGGFDSWNPALLDGDLPDDATAVLVVGP